jgi:hypothetical protein
VVAFGANIDMRFHFPEETEIKRYFRQSISLQVYVNLSRLVAPM